VSLALLLLERHRRAQEAQATAADAERYAAIAAELRAWYHPKQAAFLRSPAKRRAALCTRRSGKTAGVCREFLARALEQPGHRSMYVNEVREEARRLFWRADTKQGVVDLLEALAAAGKLTIGAERRDFAKGADVKLDEQALVIDFRNGSQIRIFAADDARAMERARGAAPHLIDVDEAQKFGRLRQFVEEVVGPSLKDYDGELLLTGTASEWVDGMFHDVTANESDDAVAAREPGWEVHEWSVADNPWFGATPEERWERAIGAELRERNVDLANPPAWVLREWFHRWAVTDARYVYSVHRWPAPVTFAPLRTTTLLRPPCLDKLNPEGRDPSGISGFIDRWYDHAASLRDLPRTLPGSDSLLTWLFGLGIDFGYNPDAFALKLWAWSPEMPADLWSMWSWKRTLVLPDYQRDLVVWFFDQVPGLIHADADPGGLQAGHLEGWREFLGIPVDDAEKSSKRTWIEMLNNDGERGRIHLREGEVHLHEMRHLVWVPKGDKLVEADNRTLADKSIPGRDACDAALYSFRRFVSRSRAEYTPPPTPGTPDWYAAEEKRSREAALEQTRARLAEERQAAGEWEYDWPR
jgi:hypothetical protein